jgi:hypothetical protein
MPPALEASVLPNFFKIFFSHSTAISAYFPEPTAYEPCSMNHRLSGPHRKNGMSKGADRHMATGTLRHAD